MAFDKGECPTDGPGLPLPAGVSVVFGVKFLEKSYSAGM